jgi:hypothetical protein
MVRLAVAPAGVTNSTGVPGKLESRYEPSVESWARGLGNGRLIVMRFCGALSR